MQVSVVMAAYNGEKYICQQIESIVNQSRIPDEILICDDSSMDSTWQKLKLYKEKYPELIQIKKNKKNIGFANNFWNTIKCASGDLIFLSDQDDIWIFNKIEEMMKIFESNSNILALSSAYELIDAEGKKYQDIKNVYFRKNRKLKKISWEKFVRHPKYPGMSMAVRKELLCKIPLDMQERFPHDWVLNQYAAIDNGMYFWDKITTQYRQHENNVVGSAANRRETDRRSSRINTILQMQRIMEYVADNVLIDYNKSRYLKMVIEISRRRIECIEQGSILKLFFYCTKYFKYVTGRSALGDIYTIVNIKKEKWK